MKKHFTDNGCLTTYKTNKKIMLKYKNTCSCEKCNYSESNEVLVFHHLDPNTKKIQLSQYDSDLSIDFPDVIKKELDKCSVLCRNCHKDVHLEESFFNEHMLDIIEKSKNIKEIQPKIDEQLVLDMFEIKKMKQVDISRELKASKGTINGILKKHAKTRNLKDFMVKDYELIRLINSGMSKKEISKNVGCSPKSLAKIIRRVLKTRLTDRA